MKVVLLVLPVLSIGGIFATPVLNYPQAGILDWRILKTPVVRDEEIVVAMLCLFR